MNSKAVFKIAFVFTVVLFTFLVSGCSSTAEPKIVKVDQALILSIWDNPEGFDKWTEVGRDLHLLNSVLEESADYPGGLFDFASDACQTDMYEDAIVVSNEPCIVLSGVADKSLESDESRYILLFFANYYSMKSISGDKVYWCEDSAWSTEQACLGNGGVVTPFWLKNPIRKDLCGFPQTEEERNEILSNLEDTGMKHDEFFQSKFSGCSLISQETVLIFERELGNEMYGW